MTKPIALLCLTACLCLNAFAQNRGNIKGKVIDSANNQPMDFATVAVMNARDSSLLSYTLTLKDGSFALHNLPAGISLKLLISFVSYGSFRKEFTLDKGALLDMGSIKLSSKISALSEVKITAETPPVVVKKDTIEFSAEAFKTPPNAVVEELLRRLPGVQVDMDGSISVNGKKVEKLLIDGKRFFANDVKIASKNLDAALIDKVQVYDDREDDPDHLIPDSKVGKIINLKFKKAIKRSTFGKVHGGGGTRDRFDAGILYNQMRDTLQVSLIGIGNNLNRTGFGSGDLANLGGFNRSNGNGYNTGLATGGNNYSGIQTVGSGGVNINDDYGKKLKINLLYFYNYSRDENDIQSLSQQFISDTTLFGNAGYKQRAVSTKHNISGLVEWNPSDQEKIRYQPKANFDHDNSSFGSNSFSYSNFVPKLHSTLSNANDNSHNFEFQHSFSYYKQFSKEGPSLNITHSIDLNSGGSGGYHTTDVTSYTLQLPSSNLDRFDDGLSKNSNGSLNISYRYPFNKKLAGTLTVNSNFAFSRGQDFIFDRNLQTGQYNIYIDSLSRNLVRHQYTESVRPELAYQFSKSTRLTTSASVIFMQTLNNFNKNVPNVNRYETFVTPYLSFNTENFYFDYTRNVRQPSINDMLPYRMVYSQLYSSVGNPDLKPIINNAFYFSYYTNNTEKQRTMSAYARFSFDENSVFNEQSVSGQGVTFSRSVNKNGGYNAYGGLNFSKGYKKPGGLDFRIAPSLNVNFTRAFFQVNNNSGFQNTVSLNASMRFFINFNNKAEINPSYNVSPQITYYQNVDFARINNTSQSVNVPLTIKGIKHWVIEGSYDYAFSPFRPVGFQRSTNLVNIAVARMFQFRDRGEIRISCYDLFNQNVNSYRFPSGNVIYDQQYQILKRYFLVTYAYRFTKTVTKK